MEPSRPYPILEAFTKCYDNPGSRMQDHERFRRLFRLAAAKYGKESCCLVIDAEYLYLADQHVAWLNGGLTYPLHVAFQQCRTGDDVFNLIFRQRRFACIFLPTHCKNHLFDTPEFLDKVEIVDSQSGLLLIAPKQVNSQ